jgi:hypothetical protein
MNFIANFAPLVIAAILFVLWPWLSTIFPSMKLEQMVATLVGLFTGTTLYIFMLSKKLQATLEEIQRDTSNLRTTGIQRDSINSAIQIALRHRRVIDHMRVFAISSGQIQPILAGQNFKANKCTLALRSFDGLTKDGQDEQFEIHIGQLIGEWQRMVTRGKITDLAVRRYNFPPTEYYLILDDAVIICGGYAFDSSNWSKVDVLDPFVILADSPDRAEYIKDIIQRHDSFWSALEQGYGANS